MEKDSETEIGEDRAREKERQKEATRGNWDKLRNSRNVRTAPHDSSMKNSTQLSPHPTLITSVNSKQIR